MCTYLKRFFEQQLLIRSYEPVKAVCVKVLAMKDQPDRDLKYSQWCFQRFTNETIGWRWLSHLWIFDGVLHFKPLYSSSLQSTLICEHGLIDDKQITHSLPAIKAGKTWSWTKRSYLFGYLYASRSLGPVTVLVASPSVAVAVERLVIWEGLIEFLHSSLRWAECWICLLHLQLLWRNDPQL